MAAIFGYIDTTTSSRPTRELAERMEKVSKHAGPTTRILTGDIAAVGWSGRSSEPKIDQTEDLAVFVTGVVRQRTDAETDLPPDLEGPELLATAWRRWGIDALSYLDGSWAAAVYERKHQVLHLIRDPAGIRPLYWVRKPGRFAFATDLPALLELPWVSRRLNRDRLAEYLSFRTVHAPRTLLEEVHQLPPGARLRWGDDRAMVRPWFTPIYAARGTPTPRTADVIPQLQDALESSVRRQLLGGANVGVYLSGGPGSAAIVAAARHLARQVNTFTVTIDDEPYPETPFAGRVARLMNMEHHNVVVSTRDIAESFDASVQALGHPIGSASVVLQLLLAQKAASTVDRVLTGDGADQLFGGRNLQDPARLLARSQRFQQIPAPARMLLREGLAQVGKGARLTTPPDELPARFGLALPEVFSRKDRERILLDDDLLDPGVRARVARPFYEEVRTDPLNTILHSTWRSTLESDTLPRVECTAAAAGVSVAFPLLSREVRRLAWLLPGSYKVRGMGGSFRTRWLLRASLKGSLPPALINRPDRGMPRPLDRWLSGPGRLFTEERVDLLRSDPLELWRHTGIEGLRRAVSRSSSAAHQLWSLFLLDSWLRWIRAN